MSNSEALIALVDDYVRADAEEKAAKAKKEAIKKQLKAEGLKNFDGTHSGLKFTTVETLTFDPDTVRAVVGAAMFKKISTVKVSTELTEKLVEKAVFDVLVRDATTEIKKTERVNIVPKVPA
jgi:hypothetical protein